VIQSPINGVVAEIFHRPGENLLPGDPILSISSKNSERIVGYLKAPCTLQPKAGMTVQMRTRSQPRIEAESKISGVGAGFEVITNVVLIHPNMPAELGVPVAVAIPPSLRNQLRPGEWWIFSLPSAKNRSGPRFFEPWRVVSISAAVLSCRIRTIRGKRIARPLL
jgi:hypothetical protein